jgi:hypothetical protein
MPSTRIGGGSSSASPPLIPVITEVSPLVSTLVGHGSTPPSSPTGSALKADFVSLSRRSGRFGVTADGASVTDEDSMQRAMRRKAEINLDYSGIISPSKSKSFLSFSTPMISSKLANVGVNIGRNDKEILFSSNALRRMEVDHLMVIPKDSAFSCTTYDDDEEAIATSDGQLLSQLIREVSDVIMDEAKLSSLYELKASGQKSGSCSSRKGKLPKKRAKVSPTSIVSQ